MTMNKLSEKYDRVVTFVSVHQAMRAEKALQIAGLEFLVVPTPRAISISCGQCMFFLVRDESTVVQILKNNKIIYNKIFVRDSTENKYEEIV